MRISDWSSDVCSSDLQQGAAVRGAEKALAPRRRAGEGALLVAEQQRLEHRLGQRRAIDRDEGAVAAARAQMDRARQHFLAGPGRRSEEHTSELQSLMRISYAVFCLKKKKQKKKDTQKAATPNAKK